MESRLISYRDQQIEMLADETVLEALERHGHAVASSCRSGICQSCVMKVVKGEVPPASQAGLKSAWQAQGYFLSCICRPHGHFQLASVEAFGAAHKVVLERVEELGADVKLLRFRRPESLDFQAGQFLTFQRDDGLSRSYSIATLPQEKETFDIHVRRVPGGQMSSWLHEHAAIGTSMMVVGPKGECFYHAESLEQPLILVGLGTGIAPLFGIVGQALGEGHQGPVHVIQGAISTDRLYFQSEWQKLVDCYDALHYQNSVLESSEHDLADTVVGDIFQLALKTIKPYKNVRVFLCGDPAIVQRLKKACFLAGVRMKNIFADPFVSVNPT